MDLFKLLSRQLRKIDQGKFIRVHDLLAKVGGG